MQKFTEVSLTVPSWVTITLTIGFGGLPPRPFMRAIVINAPFLNIRDTLDEILVIEVFSIVTVGSLANAGTPFAPITLAFRGRVVLLLGIRRPFASQLYPFPSLVILVRIGLPKRRRFGSSTQRDIL